MKMPEKHDLLAAILARTGVLAILLRWRFLRGRYNGGVYKNSNRRNVMCAIIA